MIDDYGPIFQLWLGGERMVMVNNRDIVNELCDETRFEKIVSSSLEQLRLGIGDGLFTAHNGEENWAIAHRILMPVFGPLAIREMFQGMHEISQQLCLKWARYGPSASIDVAADFTRLTLDTIALCSMGYRFNSFYRDSSFHPFVDSMVDFLTEADQQATYSAAINRLFRRRAYHKWLKDIKVLRRTSEDIISERRKGGAKSKDLLTALLEGRDPKSGKQLDDANIISNLITFLVAGHETTSGLLSFTLYYLIKNPKYLEQARKEVETVIGSAKISIHHLSKLPFIDAVLREVLRLMPTAPGFAVTPQKDEIIGRKYKVKAGESINIILHSTHRDKSVWGADAEEFKPERMYGDNFDKIPQNSWKPFGNGSRACIGRAFAWQESQLAIAMVLQNFDLQLEDPSYKLRVKETLTIKPDGFRVKASLRANFSINDLLSLNGQVGEIGLKKTNKQKDLPQTTGGKPIRILYGSNQGTCEALAQRLASDVRALGFSADQVTPLNDAINGLPRGIPVIIITASYDGQPTDNATEFLDWLKVIDGQKQKLEGVSYAVFGCGHRDWKDTYQKIPTTIDDLISKLDGDRLAPRGEADAATSDMFSAFESWEEQNLWPALGGDEDKSKYKDKKILTPKIDINLPPRVLMRKNLIQATVLSMRTLSSNGEKRYMELQLPAGQKYRPGDHIVVLPVNPQINIRRALAQFHLAGDARITVESSGAAGFPTAMPISASDLLGAYLELGSTATPRDVQTLAELTSDAKVKSDLEKFSSTLYESEIHKQQVSVLDLLEQFSSVQLPLETFLGLLPPIRLRTYSVSSSPLRGHDRVALTWSIFSHDSKEGTRKFLGAASNYLASLKTGDITYVGVRSAKAAFHIPEAPETTPVIMIAAGSGIAPFYGFIEERSMMQEDGKSLAPALLFFGCRTPYSDDLFRSDFDDMQKREVIMVYRAYSRATDHQDAAGCKYVQDRLKYERTRVVELWRKGARVYVCGSKVMADSVKLVLSQILHESGDIPNSSDGGDNLPTDRFVAEMFSH